MSVDSYRREVQRHQQEIARLQGQKANESKKVSDETRRANDAQSSARRSSSASTVQSYLRSAQRHSEAAASAQQKLAELERQLARKQDQLNGALRNLERAEDQERRTRTQAEQRVQRANEQAARREEQRRRDEMTGFHQQLAHHGHLHDATLFEIAKLQRLPEAITVLFIASGPVDQAPLRLDEEARAIHERIRLSAHRDVVKFESRWAARPLDILQAINDCNPTVVHFSGHGTPDGDLLLQDPVGSTRVASRAALVETMAAGAGIRLVFLNACHSRLQARDIVKHVAAAIGMSTAIGDEAARVFAAQFYSAIGFGRSVAAAFKQARAALMLEGIAEHDTPELCVADDVDPDELVLVQPEAS